MAKQVLLFMGCSVAASQVRCPFVGVFHIECDTEATPFESNVNYIALPGLRKWGPALQPYTTDLDIRHFAISQNPTLRGLPCTGWCRKFVSHSFDARKVESHEEDQGSEPHPFLLSNCRPIPAPIFDAFDKEDRTIVPADRFRDRLGFLAIKTQGARPVLEIWVTLMN